MSKTLIIVESPSKAKTIQKYLDENYIVRASQGHIADLAKGKNYGLGIDILNNFKPKYVINEDKFSILDELINLTKQVDLILLASDDDREGESISYHLQQRLSSCDKPIKRIIFHEITEKSIKKAIKHPQDVNLNLVRSQEGRRILDRLVGFLSSPILMEIFKNNHLSAGRVQSVAVKMIVDRDQEIKKFIPEEYWKLFVNIGAQDKIDLEYVGKLKNKQEVDTLVKTIGQNKLAISKITTKDKPQSSPPPLITSTLQQLMAKKHGFDPERTMNAAQRLYENGFCSYIRTDSVRINDEAIESVRDWLQKNEFKVPVKPNKYKNTNASFDAHEAIRPTYTHVRASDFFIGEDEKIIYQEIWNYLMASQSPPAIFSTLEIETHLISNKKIKFKASFKALKEPGFLVFLNPNYKLETLQVPNFQVNNQYLINNIQPVQKFTSPPSKYTMASLIKELENKKIGRPSTFATILKTIEGRGYVEKKNNSYFPTELGEKSINLLSQYFSFLDYKYSMSLEDKLDLIEEGKISEQEMLTSFFQEFSIELQRLYQVQFPTITFCSKCKLPQKEINGPFGKFLSCMNNHKEKLLTSATN